MNTKRGLSFVLLSLILSIFIFTLVSAQTTQPTTQAAQDVAVATQGFLTGFQQYVSNSFGVFFGEREVLTRVFFFILLLILIYTIVESVFASQRWYVTFAISAIISILSMIAIPTNFLEAIRTQYGAMGAAILSAIPFMILLVFSVRVHSALIGRVIWIFYCVYYFALYVYQIATTSAGWLSAETIPYFFAIVAGILIFFLIGPIRAALFHGEMSAIKESGKRVATRAKLLHKLQATELEESYGDKSGNKLT